MAKVQTFEALRSELVAALDAQQTFNATSLARAIGRDGTYLRDFIKGKKESIGAVELAAIEERLGVRLGAGSARSMATRQTAREVELAPEAPAFDQIGGPRNVPELGISVGGEDGDFTLNGEAIDYHTRPASLAKRNVFAVRVKGTSMEPRFDEGDLLYAERNREPRVGEDGVFEMKPVDEWSAGKAFIKRLVSKGMGVIVVEQYNPPDRITYKRDDIKDIYRIVPRNELLSV